MCAAATGVRVPHPPSPGPSEPLLQTTPATSTFSTKRGVPETFIQGFTGFQSSTNAVQTTRAEHSTVGEVNAIPPRLRAQMCTSGTHGTPSLHLTSPQNCGAHCPPHLSSVTDVQGTCTDGDASSLEVERESHSSCTLQHPELCTQHLQVVSAKISLTQSSARALA